MNPAATGTAVHSDAAISRIVAGPGRLLIVAPGGMGKTELLASLVAALEERSVPVVRVDGRTGSPLPPAVPAESALVVDDAQLLTAEGAALLARLWAGAPATRARIVVARRPGLGAATLPPGVAALTEDLDPVREQLRLEPLGQAAAAERIARFTGHQPDPEVATQLAGYTGGSPRWLDRVLAAGPAGADGRPPAALVEAVAAALALLPAHAADLAVVLGVARPELALLLAELSGHGDLADAGLTDAAGLLLPVVSAALAVATPHERRVAAIESLCARQLAGDLGARLHRLLDRRDRPAAEAFERAAQRAVDPVVALDWWQAALQCAASLAERAAASAGVAEASWAAGRIQLTAAAADVAGRHDLVATALAADGRWADAAVRYLRIDPGHDPAAPHLARLAQLLSGQPHATEPIPASDLAGQSVARVLDGLVASNGADPDAAIGPLLAAADLMEAAPRRPLPDTPHAIAALVAMALGEASAAEMVLRRALDAEVGGLPLVDRHKLLLAWVYLRSGRVASAARLADELAPRAASLRGRDRLVQLAVHAGLARRAGSLERQQAVWFEAEPVLLRVPIELTSLELIGELAPAGAKLAGDAVSKALQRAAATAGAGDDGGFATGAAGVHSAGTVRGTAMWPAAVAWAGFQAALASGQPGAVAAWAQRLAATARAAGVFAHRADAARVWTTVVSGVPNLEAARDAAETLRLTGAVWEASQLVSHAAVRCDDQGSARGLLDIARRLRGEMEWGSAEGRPARADASGGDTRLRTTGASFELTPRQREVAALLLEGRSYKEMAELLFTSVKTLERHVTDIRAKIGATDRTTLFAALRTYLGETT